mgnify:CR=1 FL=1
MDKTTTSQLDVVLLAEQALEYTSSDKYNHLHLYLDGLKNHIILYAVTYMCRPSLQTIEAPGGNFLSSRLL